MDGINVLTLLWIALGIGVVIVVIIFIFKFFKQDNAALELDKAIQKKEFKKALKLGQKFIEKDPDNFMVKFKTAQAHEGLKEYKDAITLYEKASVAAKAQGQVAIDSQITIKIANLYKLQNRPKEALGYYKMVLDKYPRHAKALFEISGVLMTLKYHKRAKSYLESLIKMKPGNLRARFMLSKIYYHLNDNSQAIEQLKSLLEKLPQKDTMHDKALMLLGNVHARQRRFELAVKVLYPLLDNKDLFEIIIIRIITFLIHAEKLDQAETVANKYIKKVSRELKAEITYMIAGTYFKKGDIYKALTMWREAHQFYPEYKDLKKIMEKYDKILSNPNMENIFTNNNTKFESFAIKILRLKFVSNIIKQDNYWVFTTEKNAYIVYKRPFPVPRISMDDMEKHMQSSNTSSIILYTLFGVASETKGHHFERRIEIISEQNFIDLVNQG